MEKFTITSPTFKEGESIPSQYTCDGDRHLSPPLLITGLPEGTNYLALIMDDPDIPQVLKEARGIEAFDHWVVYNLAAQSGTTVDIPEGGPLVAASGLNSAGNTGYTGPCPPSEHEPSEHRYIFVVYALSDRLVFLEPPTKQQVLDAIPPFLLGQAELVGRYKRR
jgi:Raf kinase inhibitor-like YbhB/YbcL family protein